MARDLHAGTGKKSGPRLNIYFITRNGLSARKRILRLVAGFRVARDSAKIGLVRVMSVNARLHQRIALLGDSTLFIHEIASDWPMTQGAIVQSVKV